MKNLISPFFIVIKYTIFYPDSRFPIPDSRFPIPDSLLPTPFPKSCLTVNLLFKK
ncbi:MAG: hypothetical protein F6K65_25670 [Moorea sp. SIO3C2]|nr:hypothetical protein [Moorena sp. SIO3C2]